MQLNNKITKQWRVKNLTKSLNDKEKQIKNSKRLTNHTIRIINHIEENKKENNDDDNPTFREITTKAALLQKEKKVPEARGGVSSQRIGEHPNTDLPLNLFNIGENEKKPNFLPQDSKDFLIASMRWKLEEKDKDISNLNRKLDEVLEMVVSMQTHVEVQQCNPEL